MPRRRRRHRFELNADINVVSLIDVMLLLLVIFMITAPMMQGGIDLTLPTADAAKPLESKEGLTISITRPGDIYIDEAKYSIAQFRTVFKTLNKNRLRSGVYLRADKGVPYEIVLQAITIMNQNGVDNVGLVSQTEESR